MIDVIFNFLIQFDLLIKNNLELSLILYFLFSFLFFTFSLPGSLIIILASSFFFGFITGFIINITTIVLGSLCFFLFFKNIFKKFSPEEGVPDGMTLDKNKNLWVAHFRGACVSVFNSKAKLIHRIHFPAKNITNCAFGGKNNQELYVSTATKGMNKADLRKFRYSGFFFSVKTNSKGILQKKFILSNEEKRSLL